MLYRTVSKYCSLFRRGLKRDDLRLFLESSPGYPNLGAVVATLRYVGLNVEAARCDGSGLDELHGPALLHLKHKGRESLVIGQRDDMSPGAVKLMNPNNNQWEVKTSKSIGQHWDGVVIYAKDSPLGKRVSNETILGLLLIMIVLATIIFYGVNVLFFIPIVIGLTTAIYQYFKFNDNSHRIIERLCWTSALILLD